MTLSRSTIPLEKGKCIGDYLRKTFHEIRTNEDQVTEIDFSKLAQYHRPLKDNGAILLARVFESNTHVRSLQLQDNEIGDRGVCAMATMLKLNSTLVYIDLYGNDIGDVGAIAIANALYGHISLEHLGLWSNKITDKGAVALADALMSNSSLVYLGLVHNRITDKGALQLLNALKNNFVLQTLTLASNDIDPSIITEIGSTLAENRIRYLGNKSKKMIYGLADVRSVSGQILLNDCSELDFRDDSSSESTLTESTLPERDFNENQECRILSPTYFVNKESFGNQKDESNQNYFISEKTTLEEENQYSFSEKTTLKRELHDPSMKEECDPAVSEETTLEGNQRLEDECDPSTPLDSVYDNIMKGVVNQIVDTIVQCESVDRVEKLSLSPRFSYKDDLSRTSVATMECHSFSSSSSFDSDLESDENLNQEEEPKKYNEEDLWI